MADSELVQKVKVRKVSSLACKENKGRNTTVYAKENTYRVVVHLVQEYYW